MFPVIRIPQTLRLDLLAAVICALILAYVVTDGDWNFNLPAGHLEEFYDAQAQSLMQGRIDVPAAAIDREAFVRNGKFYGYFGPTPALLRIPALFLAPDTYGRWNRISMLSGSLVILASLILLFRRIEQAMDLSGPFWAASRCIVMVSAVFGSTNLFISTEAKVYQEAIMWGSAFAMASSVCLICFLCEPSRKRWVWLSCLTGFLAFFARVSSGLGPLAGLALACAALLFPARARFLGCEVPDRAASSRALRAFAFTLAVSSVLWAGLNYWKFGMPFTSQPLALTIDSDPQRLQRTKGDAFSLLNIPLTARVYLWPAGLTLGALFPFFYLRAADPGIAASFPWSHFDAMEFWSSLPASMPLLFFGALAGTLLCWSGPHAKRLRPFRVPLAGALAGCFVMFTWGYISFRYLQDALPWMTIGAAVALAHLEPLRSPQLRRGLLAGAALAALWGLSVNAAFAAMHLRYYAFPEPDDKRVAFADFRSTLHADGVSGAWNYLTHWHHYHSAAMLARGNVVIFEGEVTSRSDQPVVSSEGDAPALAGYALEVPQEGMYEISVLYASAEPRPVRVLLQGKLAGVLQTPTGGLDPGHQRWASVGRFQFQKGRYDFALASDGKFPVVRMIRLTRI